MSSGELPEVYQSLLKRVEEIEQKLSQKAISGDAKYSTMTDHSEDAHAKEVDEDTDFDISKVAPVVITSKAYLKLAIHAKKYANPSIKKTRWVEVIGLLTGRIKNENTPVEQIEITDACPIGHGDAVSVQIMGTQSVAQIMNDVPKGDFIVGWYHSHPSYTPFMSTDDHATQARYQALWSKAIALVIDPTMITPSDFGFGIFRNTMKETSNFGYTELSAEVDGLSHQAAKDILDLIRPAFEGEELKFIEYE